MITLLNLSKVYRRKAVSVTALQDVSLEFPDTGMVFVLGRSGSGKSTLLHIMGGLDTLTSGEVRIDGKPLHGLCAKELDDYRNNYVGFIFQDYNLIEHESVGRNVAIALEMQGEQADREKIEDTLRRVDLVENGHTLYDRSVRDLSGGQRQRVAIARALVKQPRIVLADEPTGALDSKTGKQLYALLQELSKERLVVVVTHDEASAKTYGDRIIELSDGEVVSDKRLHESAETPADVRSPRLVKGKLPFRRVFTMGMDGLRQKRLRLILSILLSAVAFFLFGFSFTASFANRYQTEFKTAYDRGLQMATFSLGEEIPSGKWEALAAYQGEEPILVFHPWRYKVELMYIAEYLGTNDVYGRNNPYVRVGTGYFNYFAELDPKTGEQDANLRIDERFEDRSLCRLPQTYNEIAITDIRADMFFKFGYREADGSVTQVKTPDDLIGKRLGEFTICGVYSTEMDTGFLKSHDIDQDPDYDSVPVNTALNSALNGIVSYGFVREGFLEQHTNEKKRVFAMVKLKGDLSEDMRLIEALTEASDEDSDEYYVVIATGVSGEVSGIADIITMILQPAKIGAVLFCVFAALLQINFLMVSLDRKKIEFGILRALGARQQDISIICLTESLLIAMIDFIIATLAVCITCIAINRLYSCALLIPGVLQIGALLLLCFGVAMLSAVVPAVRISRQRPIDVIRSVE